MDERLSAQSSHRFYNRSGLSFPLPPKQPSMPFVPLPERPHPPHQCNHLSEESYQSQKISVDNPISYGPNCVGCPFVPVRLYVLKGKIIRKLFFSKYRSFDPKMQTFDAMASH